MHIDGRALRAFWVAALIGSVAACDDDDDSGRDGGAEDGGMQDGGGSGGEDDGGGSGGKDDGGGSGGEDDGGGSGGMDDGGGSGGKDDGGGSSGGDSDPVYAFATQIFGENAADTTTYVVLSDRLDRDLKADDAEVSVEGRALVVGPDSGGALFVGGDAGPTITRYDLQDDGTLEKGETVSFANKGLSGIGEYPGQFYFASDDKAYFFDGGTAQIVVWNPEAMTVVDDISLSELSMEQMVLSFSTVPVVDGDTVYQFPGWRSANGTSVPSEAGVVVLDTKGDSATVVTDDRCGYVRDGVIGDDGYLYLVTETFGSAVHRVNEEAGPAPCILRFDMEEEEFDADYKVELNELFDGEATGGLLVGPGGHTYVSVLDEDAVTVTDMTFPRALASAAQGWRWASLTVGDDAEGELLDDVDPGYGSVIPMPLGDKLYIPQFQMRESTDMREVTEDGPGDVTLNIPGLVFSALKLQ